MPDARFEVTSRLGAESNLAGSFLAIDPGETTAYDFGRIHGDVHTGEARIS
jgi:hypothetical protein